MYLNVFDIVTSVEVMKSPAYVQFSSVVVESFLSRISARTIYCCVYFLINLNLFHCFILIGNNLKMDTIKKYSEKTPTVEKCFCCLELRTAGIVLGIFCIVCSFWPSVFIIFIVLPGHICWFFGLFKV